MNIPNKITVSRILLIPLFVIVMMFDFGWGNMTLFGAEMQVNYFVGALIFIFASATDWVDGYYARKYNLVTNLGSFWTRLQTSCSFRLPLFYWWKSNWRLHGLSLSLFRVSSR